jgi:hypothetical protein
LEARERHDKLAAVSNPSQPEPLAVAAANDRFEWLFLPNPGRASKVAVGLGMLGCAAAGAGVYGAWLAPQPVSGASLILIGGVVIAAVASLAGPKQAPPVRVSELGVIVGDPAEARRVPWYEIDAVRFAGEELRLESKGENIALPLAAHGRAAARIVAEASQRIPTKVDISPKAHDRLPRLGESEGERVPAARLQLAGQRCAASGTSITFEGDARLCPNCAALYHARHVPAACARCERPLSVSGSSGAARAAI